MPTPDSAEAFAKLVEAREKLSEITKQLNEAHPSSSRESRQRYLDLQKAWEEAFQRFGTATDEFSAVVHRLKAPEESSLD